MNKRFLYAAVNIMFFIIAFFYLWREMEGTTEPFPAIAWPAVLWVISIILGFFVIHFLKMLRLYFVLIEQKIGLLRFAKVYFKTTFVNMMIPFKLGEIFRIYCFSHETKLMQVGILCVVLDRFFDTVGLLLLIIPLEVFMLGKVSLLTGLLLTGIVVMLFIYLVFSPTYYYLNKFLIVNTTSRRSITLLHALEQVKLWFDYIRQLIKGRYAVILLISLMGWAAEAGVLFLLALLLGRDFTLNSYISYLQAIFSTGENWLLSCYTLISALLLAVTTGILYILSLMGNRGRKNA